MRNNKTLFLLTVIVFAFSCLSAYAQYDVVFKQPYPRRFNTIDSIRRSDVYGIYRHDSPKVFDAINKLRKLARQANDAKALLQLDIIELGYIDEKKLMDTALFEKKALAVLEEAEKINYPQLIASARIMLGIFYFYNVKRYGDFFVQYLRAYDILHSFTSEEYYDRSYCIHVLSLSYYKFYDYTNAIKYARVVIGDSSTEKYIRMFSCNVIGMSYHMTSMYDSARKYFRLTADIAEGMEQNFRKSWLSISIGNLGHTWYKQRDYSKAIACYDTAIHYAKETGLWGTATPMLCNMAHIYIGQKNAGKAETYISQARFATYREKSNEAYLDLYDALSSFYRERNDLKPAMLYSDSSIIYKDSVAKDRDLNVKNRAEVEVEIERRGGIEKLLKSKLEKQNWIRNTILTGFILLLLVFALLYSRQRLKSKLIRQHLENEKQKTEKDLAAVTLRLKDFTDKIKEKNALLEHFESELSKLQAHPARAVSEDENILAEMQNAVILTDEDWDNFRPLFDKVHKGFFNRMKETLPGVSPAESRFMVLAKLKFTNKEMANSLGISPQAVRTTWYRLRKKFALPEGGLEELIASI